MISKKNVLINLEIIQGADNTLKIKEICGSAFVSLTAVKNSVLQGFF